MFGVWIGVRGCYSVSPCVLLIYEEIKGRTRCTIRLISSMVFVQHVLKIIKSSGCNSPNLDFNLLRIVIMPRIRPG